MHQRRKCLNAISNILLGNPQEPGPTPPVYPITEVGPRIFTNRRNALWKEEFPCVCLYSGNERATNDSNPPVYYRVFPLIVEVLVSDSRESDSLCDNIIEKVEALLLNTTYLKDPVFDYEGVPYTGRPADDPAVVAESLKLTGTNFDPIPENKEANVTSGYLIFEVEYKTIPGANTSLNNFNTVGVMTKVVPSSVDTPPMNSLTTNIYQGV